MADFSKGAALAAGKQAGARATGETFYVDSVDGNDGNAGDRFHPVKTLTQAVALAEAGDRIVLNPGGSETVTAAIALAVDDLEIVCECGQPGSGFTITGAGTLDLITVAGADCLISGLILAHTGATANQAGVNIAAGGDRTTVRNCRFDDSAIATTFTGAGVELVSGADDVQVLGCEFLDTKFGVLVAASGAAESDRLVVADSTFYVGRSAAFGVAAAQATGKLQGPRILRCLFIEANGDGAAAASAWDGTNGANATQGPVLFGAAVDQYVISDCRAFAAASVTFANLNAINAGAAGDIVTSLTGVDEATAVGSVGTLVSSALSATVSLGVAGSTAHSSGLSATVSLGVANSTAHSSGLSATVSLGTADSTAHSTTLVAVQAVGKPVSKVGSIADNAVPNNTQAAGGELATAVGDVLIEDIILTKDATAFAGPTNLEISTNNVYGDTGAADPTALVATATLAATTKVSGSGTAVFGTLKFPTVLESGKKLYIHGDDAAGNSAGVIRYAIIGRALSAGGSLT